MKRLIVIFCSLFIIPFSGCNLAVNNNSDIQNKPSYQAPSKDIDNLPEEEVPETKPNDEERKKKYYAVSLVDGLRVRNKPNGNSSVLGSLDKNDAVLLIETIGEYYETVFKEQTAYVYASYCKVMEIEYSNEQSEKAIELGCSLLGYPYVWGSQRYHWGNGVLNKNFVAGKFDCSALVQYIYFISNNVVLDVNTRTQVLNGKEVNLSDLSRGDLMFFTNASRKNKTGVERIGHVGIYFGNNYILHTASDHAVIEPISQTRWDYYITSRRVV